MYRVLLSSLFFLVLTACRTSSSGDLKQLSDGQQPMELANLNIFDKTHVYFASNENNRIVQRQLSIPDSIKNYDSARLLMRLSCPNDRCDYWDRKGQIFLYKNVNGEDVKFELMRFITPYGVGVGGGDDQGDNRLIIDASDLLPILNGDATFEVFIDTWVGPGHDQGEGWLVDLTLELRNEGREKVAVEVRNILTPTPVPYGKVGVDSKQTKNLENLPEHSSSRIISYVTGHGQNYKTRQEAARFPDYSTNKYNCAEFCERLHTFTVGGVSQSTSIWRGDCAKTRTDKRQRGNYTVGRAGWCPGDKVNPIIMDFDKPLLPGQADVSWEPEAWVNPEDENYNGGSHTEPYYSVSALLVLYK